VFLVGISASARLPIAADGRASAPIFAQSTPRATTLTNRHHTATKSQKGAILPPIHATFPTKIQLKSNFHIKKSNQNPSKSNFFTFRFFYSQPRNRQKLFD
jgi:hypothetical protein